MLNIAVYQSSNVLAAFFQTFSLFFFLTGDPATNTFSVLEWPHSLTPQRNSVVTQAALLIWATNMPLFFHLSYMGGICDFCTSKKCTSFKRRTLMQLSHLRNVPKMHFCSWVQIYFKVCSFHLKVVM